ncbi:MAG: hypothetical protein M1825_002103 [Sarcosagium campestre]|nr:MAG: hypothetical protein M1825_002103 [Sarcosagium campestre]
MIANPPLLVRLLTHNIRYATAAPFVGEELWPVRRPKLTNELIFNTRHCLESFICLQEVLHDQLLDILSDLNRSASQSSSLSAATKDDWTYIGVGRNDGEYAGEYSPIFYRPAVWKLKSFKTIWLSETPSVPSRGWDAASIRILTVGVFQHQASKKRVVAMNTHLDDQGSKSRENSAKIIVREIEEYSSKDSDSGPTPVFLAGDFNSEEGQEAYQVLNDAKSPVQDLRDFVTPERRYGHEETFTGFRIGEIRKKRIDFLFVGPRGAIGKAEIEDQESLSPTTAWLADQHAVLSSRFDDGVINSDHRAVVGDVLLV